MLIYRYTNGKLTGASMAQRRMHFAAGVGVAALLGLLASVRPHAAYACAFPAADHCYAEAQFTTPGRGELASEALDYIYLGCVAVPNQNENINSDELWAIMNDGSWMEAGIVTGATDAGDMTTPHFFVSDSIRGSNPALNEHIGAEAPTYTANLTRIWQASPEESTTWYGWTFGTGTVTVPGFSNRYGAVELQTGLETSTDGGWNDAAVTHMEYLNWNGDVYTTEWRYGSSQAKAEILGPESGSEQMYFTWETRNWEADFGFHNHGC
jgi:hypothetical protein